MMLVTIRTDTSEGRGFPLATHVVLSTYSTWKDKRRAMAAMASSKVSNCGGRPSSEEVAAVSKRLFSWAYEEHKTTIQIARTVSNCLNEQFPLSPPMPWPNHSWPIDVPKAKNWRYLFRRQLGRLMWWRE